MPDDALTFREVVLEELGPRKADLLVTDARLQGDWEAAIWISRNLGRRAGVALRGREYVVFDDGTPRALVPTVIPCERTPPYRVLGDALAFTLTLIFEQDNESLT